MDKIEKKVVLITGASSGIGLDASKMFLELGYKVYGAARRVDLLKEIESLGGNAVYLDLTDENSIKKCVDKVIEKEGGIDILVNNAGYGLGGTLENISIDEARRQFEVNVFGLARITQLVLPFMREQKSGRIVNVSSIAGKFSSPFLGWYHATKYSVEAYSDALRLEVAPFGISVSIIEPGMIQTDWGTIAADNVEKYSKGTVYEENGAIVGNYYRKYYGNKKASDPVIVAKTIVKAGTVKKPKIRYRVGKFAILFTTTVRIFNDSVLDFIIKFVFGLK